jgi:hypothetical protein
MGSFFTKTLIFKHPNEWYVLKCGDMDLITQNSTKA